MKLAGVICSHETRCQIMVQNVPELRPKSLNGTRIEGGEICNKPIQVQFIVDRLCVLC